MKSQKKTNTNGTNYFLTEINQQNQNIKNSISQENKLHAFDCQVSTYTKQVTSSSWILFYSIGSAF